MSERPTLCTEQHQIEWLTEVVGVCVDHEWLWYPEREEGRQLRRAWPTPFTDALVVALREVRAQLASATATIAEQTQRADAAEGREAGLRMALRGIVDRGHRIGFYSIDWAEAGNALATPANGAGDVLRLAVKLADNRDIPNAMAELIGQFFAAVAAWQKREGEADGAIG